MYRGQATAPRNSPMKQGLVPCSGHDGPPPKRPYNREDCLSMLYFG